MKVILFCILICLTFGIRAQQTDYAKLRPSVLVTACGVQDSSIVNTSIRNLLALDTSGIIKNMHMYYEDLGQCYWMKSGGKDGQHYLQLSIEVTNKALYHQPESSKALWNLAFAHTMMGDCEKGRSYIEKYKLATRKKYWDEDQIRLLLERCSI
ncbi:MAG TPA: hypothetical protein PLV75_08635 [Saprospiraceae bacterium]|jgi:hypothetical protein|nr:hypothetical protein [Saprospiraceae bacterium]HQW26012.1 hypothetical protein [Saprospiraceae bacterium]